MSSRSLSWTIAIVLVIAGLIFAGLLGGGSHTIRRDENYIQAKINQHLPKTAHGITVRSAVVHIQDSHVHILAEISGTIKGKVINLVAEATGVPDYENSRHGDFYFLPQNVAVDDITYDDEPPGELIRRFADHSRFKFVRNALDNAAQRTERAFTHAAENGAMLALEHVPVYRLKDEGIGWYVRAALEKVDIEGNQVVVTYSLWHFTIAAIWFTVMVGVGIACIVALLVCPECGEIFAFLP